MASRPIILTARRFVGPGSEEPPVVNEALTQMLGKPLHENSEMDQTATTGDDIILAGNFKRFLIVDRSASAWR